jgi:hypothetical protein
MASYHDYAYGITEACVTTWGTSAKHLLRQLLRDKQVVSGTVLIIGDLHRGRHELHRWVIDVIVCLQPPTLKIDENLAKS